MERLLVGIFAEEEFFVVNRALGEDMELGGVMMDPLSRVRDCVHYLPA